VREGAAVHAGVSIGRHVSLLPGERCLCFPLIDVDAPARGHMIISRGGIPSGSMEDPHGVQPPQFAPCLQWRRRMQATAVPDCSSLADHAAPADGLAGAGDRGSRRSRRPGRSRPRRHALAAPRAPQRRPALAGRQQDLQGHGAKEGLPKGVNVHVHVNVVNVNVNMQSSCVATSCNAPNNQPAGLALTSCSCFAAERRRQWHRHQAAQGRPCREARRPQPGRPLRNQQQPTAGIM